MHWKPLLSGAVRDDAESAAVAILRHLTTVAPEPAAGWTLDKGAAGVAVALAVGAQRGLAPGDAASRWLDAALDVVASQPTPAGLWSGYTGVAWALREVDAELDGADDVEAREVAEVVSGRAGVDVYSGAAGFGLVALGSRPTAATEALVDAAIDRLARDAEAMDVGIAWRAMPTNDRAAREHPDGFFSTGMAHGTAGIIAFLARAAVTGAGERRARARHLVDEAIAWLFSLRGDERGARYPFLVDGAHRRYKSSVWCNGDIGVAAGLAVAGLVLEMPAWLDEAVATAHHAFARGGLDPRVSEPCVCHGAAGVAHLYNRLAQVTGDEVCADAARAWFGRTLSMRSAQRGVAGFSFATRVAPAGDAALPTADPSLLLGAGGVALALLAATSSVEPVWDHVLGCSSGAVASLPAALGPP
jgi:hypothetical protein